MSVFNDNIAAIGKNNPQLAQRLLSLPGSERIKKISDSLGKAGLEVKGPSGTKELSLHDLHMPELDARAEEMGAARMIVILGFGSGALFSEVVMRATQQTYILLIEPDIDLFKAILAEIDYSKLFELDRVSISVGEKAQAATFIQVEAEYGVFTLSEFSIVENRWSLAVYEEYFSTVSLKLSDLKEFGWNNLHTLSNLSALWRENIFRNLPAIISHKPIAGLLGLFSGVPALIVSAGPSLDKNVRFLTAFKGLAFIIAVDTAVRSLMDAGVTPDIVVSLDAKDENYLHLKGLNLTDSLMVLNPVVNPQIVNEAKGPMMFCDYADPLFIWIEKMIGSRGNIRAGGSVATSAFDLAVKMGCSPIILIGQDMSFSEGRTHAGATTHETVRGEADKNLTIENFNQSDEGGVEQYLEIKDIFDKPVISNPKMISWRLWYEMIIERENVKVFNATEGGIEIKGAQSISLAHALTRMMGANSLGDTLAKVNTLEPDVKTGPLLKGLQCARDESREVKNRCGLGITETQNLFKKVESGEMTLDEALENLKKINVFSREILSRETFSEANRWSVDMIVDKVEKLGIAPTGSEMEGLGKTLQSFYLLFTETYKVASDFEKSVSGAISSIKRIKPMAGSA